MNVTNLLYLSGIWGYHKEVSSALHVDTEQANNVASTGFSRVQMARAIRCVVCYLAIARQRRQRDTCRILQQGKPWAGVNMPRLRDTIADLANLSLVHNSHDVPRIALHGLSLVLTIIQYIDQVPHATQYQPRE